MPILFEFTDVFAEWATDFEQIPKGGGYYDYSNGGKWVAGFGEPIPMSGIVVPFSKNELQFDPGGTYTRHDRKIYLQLPYVLGIDDYIRVKDVDYRVLDEWPYEDYAGFNIYVVKRVDTRGRGLNAKSDSLS